MKRFLVALLTFLPLVMTAQEQREEETITVFCELLGINKNVLGIGDKISVQVDFGDDKNFWGNDGRDMLVDENGKDIKFNSMVDAMNFMGERGWVFEDSYVVTIAKQNVIHWLLSKKIRKGEDSRGDIQQKRDMKKKKVKKTSDEYRNADPIYD